MDPGRRTLAGRYRLEEVIGRGGMSTVYRATDLVLGRTVAVKLLLAALAEDDPISVARFQREARAAAGLTHPAVVTVYDSGTDGESRYIVMEYVEGRSLASILRDRGALEPREAALIAQEVADALRAAHAAGVLHRDIKPANVMVADNSAVKVLDFGIARRLDGTTLTQAASLVGTAAYMPPERALGESGDERSDVYSLGCLLYAMLTGDPPFGGDSAAALLHQQVNAEPRPPSQSARIPQALDALVLGMLAKEPERRPQTAAAVRDRLAAFTGSRLGPEAPATPATAATAPLERTAATRVLAPAHRFDRRPAAVAALVTAAVLLVVIALAAGGGGSPHPRSLRSHLIPAHTTSTSSVAATTATAATPPPQQAKKPKPAKPGPVGGPPGHGGVPPGQAKKKHGGEGGGGD